MFINNNGNNFQPIDPTLIIDKRFGSSYYTIKNLSEQIETVTSIAESIDEILTVYENIDKINTTVDNINEIKTVNTNITTIKVVSDDMQGTDSTTLDLGSITASPSSITVPTEGAILYIATHYTDINKIVTFIDTIDVDDIITVDDKASSTVFGIVKVDGTTITATDGVISATASTPTWGSITGTLSDQTDLSTALAAKASTTDLTTHTSNTSNPHSVTKAQVGLGNAENTADLDKPISTATQTALDLKANLSGAAFTGNISFASTSGSTTETAITISESTGDSLVLNHSSEQDITLTINAGSANKTWTKIIAINAADITAITLNTGWYWVNGDTPSYPTGTGKKLLVLYWCDTFGIASLVKGYVA